MEKRKSSITKSSDLPVDFLKMVADIFATNFDASLKAIKKLKGRASKFEANGSIWSEEIVLAVSLRDSEELVATTVYGSVDFDPKASAPTIQDLLNACVDAVGTIFGQILTGSPDKLERLLDPSLSALENVPFEWTTLEVEKFRVHVKVDKANPKIDQMADEWLKKHDPKFKELEEDEEAATEDLFVTGPKGAKGARGSGGAGTLQ